MTTTTLRTAAATALAAGALLASTATASAQRLAITDVAGDAYGDGLDITRVAVANRDHGVAADVDFAADRAGTAIVLIKARRGSTVGVVYRHRSSAPDETFCVTLRGSEAPCRGATGDYDAATASLHLRLPARSLDNGNYGAIRVRALTEVRGGADSDYAPERHGDLRPTDWIPRG